MALEPKESGKLISELAKHVQIKQEGIEKLGKQVLVEYHSGRLKPENFAQHHPKSTDPNVIDWFFVVDTLNFCFWKPEGEIGWTVDGQTGYFALCAAVNRALNEGIDLTNPNYYSKITEHQLSHILRSDNQIPVQLIQERVQCLHEIGTKLLKQFNGTFKTCVKACEHSALKLLRIIIENFPNFRDEAIYKGHKVGLYKRAQILIADIWICFKNEDDGYFKDINELTMFADYRVPQSLIYFGALEYSDKLKSVLETNGKLENGSEFEVEIRGCSIHAVELVKNWIRTNSSCDANSIMIDYFLWDFRRNHAETIERMKIPFHKTFSIYY